ncbi:MAG TPA: hypothetical protein VNG51_24055, partial [Ktedonobacteraceae bacterium]|nr:hypothetical protein [Ktedonobacteraceae bacterium]
MRHEELCAYLSNEQPFITPPRRNHRRIVYRIYLLSFLLCLSMLANVLGNWPVPTVSAATIGHAHPKPGALTFQHYLQQGRHNKAASGSFIPPAKLPPPPGTQHDKPGPTLPSAEPPTMKPLTATLSSAFLSAAPGTQPLDLKSSDGRLEVQMAPGTFDLSHASVATGKKSGKPQQRTHASQSPVSSGPSGQPSVTGPLTLTITEQHGYFVGEQVMLGQYQFALTDGQGYVVSGVVVRTPITVRYHYQEQIMTQFDLDPGHLFLTWPTAIMAAAKLHHIATGAMLPLHNDAKTHTLTTPITSVGPGPFTFTGDPSNESPPVPHLAGVQGNSGQLSYTYPIDTPPGPDGFGPALQLAYSSEAVNERHGFNQPAGDIGDGWAFSLGAISADVHGASSAGGSLTWYNLSGVDGISDRLVPTSNPNVYVTQHLTYLKIDYDTTNNCFRVWDMSGTYYEFGCVPSAQQYHKDTDGTIHYYRWDLDKVIAPNEGDTAHEKSMTISYLQDCQPVSTPCPTASNANNGTAIRDASVKQITVFAGSTIVATTNLFYQGPNTITDSNGVTWETQYSSSYYTACKPPKTTSLRCDDPINYSGGLLAPTVMSTLSLQQIVSYVGPDPQHGSGGQLAYQYTLTYLDSPFTAFGWNGAQCADPTQPSSPSVYEYCAGEHLLSSITESIYNSGNWHALKPVLFDYAQHTNSYADFNQDVPGTGNIYQVHVTWQYLADYVDANTGVGGHVVFETGYGNTHGTPNVYDGNGDLIDDRHDPTFCFNHATCTGSYAGPDDGQWTGQLVTSITTLGSDSGSLGAATTTYYYHLGDIPNLNTCPAAGSGNTYETDCPTDTWRPSNDGDWQDYYDGEFFGFQGVFTLSPANNLTESLYYSTEGLNTPYSNYGNYTNGQLYEEDVYAGSGTYDPLLEQTTTDYAGNPNDSNPSPPNACDGSFSGVYPPCEAMPTSTVTAQCEGVSGCSTNAQTVSWPQATTTYTYDDYDTTHGLKYAPGNYHNLLQEQTSSNNAPTVTSKWTYKPDDQTIGSTVYYDVNKVVHSEIDDSSGTVWRCQDITYDEGNSSGVAPGTPVAGWPTTVTSYSNCADTTHTAITNYTGYDAYGNVVATVDGVATANSTLYGSSGTAPYNGCTLSTNPVIMSSNWGKTNYTTCTVYDQYSAQPTTVSNAFGYTNTFAYDYTQGGLPISVTDYNNQATTTAYSFDSNSSSNDKRITDISQPGECQQPGCYTTQSNSYSSCASSIPTGTTTPCFQENENTSEYSSVVSSTFYDSLGRVVESSTPAPPPANPQSGMSYFTIILRAYNDQQNTAWQSVPFVVAVTTNQSGQTGAPWLDPATARDYNNVAPAGTTTYLDALERPIAMKDPLFGQSGVPGIACSATLSGNYTSCTNYNVGQINGGTKDSNDYAITTSVDPNAHVGESFGDTLGRTIYTQAFSGLYGGTLTASEQTTAQ